jgi:hypothetical protein
MKKSLDFYICKLPKFIGKEIFKFIIPEKNTIKFLKYYPNAESNYSNIYDIAFLNNIMIKKNGLMLSRIEKKNGNHRYYFTKKSEKFYCDGCGKKGCTSQYCRGNLLYVYNYQSQYIGKDLDLALLELYNKNYH